MRAARKAVRIIETGSVQLGREIEMLSPTLPYHHQGHCAKAIKEQKKEYLELCRIQESRTQVNKVPCAHKAHTPKRTRMGMTD